MVIQNQELFIMAQSDSDTISKLFILSPEVFVRRLTSMYYPAVELAMPNQPLSQEKQKLFPIELHLGGIVGTHNLNSLMSRSSKFILYFDTLEVQLKWAKILE
mmetsp:Transcript_28814/g.43515  ORF Transcript_28814/g.43515 Transcript_28814/m.43515 type:complete len:103 (+) Transcript_28814:1128-1436(+)